ncbi:MAG: hypothetical protein ACRBB6_04285 [Neptuniibacter sp.]
MITEQRAATGMIQKYLGTAYDHVKKVADEIEGVKALADSIDANTDFQAMANVITTLGSSVSDLAALASADLTAISDDLNKGNYVGNRKVDIDLALNNTSETTEVTYQGMTITTNDGVVVQINFETLDEQSNPVVNELSSYTAIYNELVAGIAAYNAGEADPALHIVNTEIDIINSTLPELPTMIRLRDTDGSASNIDRIQLQVYSGQAVEAAPTYYWAKTTSALQTLANRVGDVIALGNDIDSIIELSAKTVEIDAIYTNREALVGATNSLYSELSKLQTLHANLIALLNVENNLTGVLNVNTNIASVNTVSTNIADVNSVATNMADIQNAEANAQAAATSAQTASDKSDEIKAVTVGSTVTGAAGTSANVVYDAINGEFTFVIPQGNKGDKGDAFQVNAVGLFASRSTYDAQAEGFSFLATDTSTIYFKLSNTSGDWSSGAPFGKGDKGDTGDTGNGIATIAWTSTTGVSAAPNEPGETDTYTVTYVDATTDTFTVYNGADGVQINDAGTSGTETWSSTKIASELSGKAASNHTHTLSEVTDAGTAAGLNVPASGDAAAGEVVKGDDSRLSDARAPTAHSHLIGDLPSDVLTETSGDTRYYLQSQVDTSLAAKQDIEQTVTDLGNQGSGTVTLDLSGGKRKFKVTVTGPITLAVSNWPAAGKYAEFELELVNGGAFAVILPTINWLLGDGSSSTTFGDTNVALNASGSNTLVGWSTDNGSTVYGVAG